jgi:predicted metal-dependent hydrolase
MFRRRRPPLAILGDHNITLNGRNINYTLKRSQRASYARLEIKRDGSLTVVIPKSYDMDRLQDLLREKQRWILRKLAEYEKARPRYAERCLEDGDTVPYLGRELSVVIQRSAANSGSVRLERDRLIVNPGSNNSDIGMPLERWYRERAAGLLRIMADEISAGIGVKYRRLTIRGQRTRWGSCSHKGNLSFNWKLMMAPEAVIEYVVTHEVAHLKEMNHTRRFWKLVEKHCPRWREHRKWLKEHEAELAA